jgi:hypothetical protein
MTRKDGRLEKPGPRPSPPGAAGITCIDYKDTALICPSAVTLAGYLLGQTSRVDVGWTCCWRRCPATGRARRASSSGFARSRWCPGRGRARTRRSSQLQPRRGWQMNTVMVVIFIK